MSDRVRRPAELDNSLDASDLGPLTDVHINENMLRIPAGIIVL